MQTKLTLTMDGDAIQQAKRCPPFFYVGLTPQPTLTVPRIRLLWCKL
jgi:hypothetical protein